MDPEPTAREIAVTSDQNVCDDPDCACQDAADRPGDGAAEVLMTEVYDIDFSWGHHPSGW